MKARLVLAAAIAVFAVGPAAGAHASTCSPEFQDICYQTCNLNGVTYWVCSHFR